MPEIDVDKLKEQIEKKKTGCLYFLYGEEPYLVSAYLKRIVTAAIGKDYTPFNYQAFSGEDVNIDDLVDALMTFSFMASVKCVVLSNFDIDSASSDDIQKLSDYIEDPNENSVFIMYYTLPDIIKNSAICKSFIKHFIKYGDVINFKKKTAADTEKLLCSYASKLKCELSRKNANYLIELCGNDLTTLFNETDKLCAYVKSGEITRSVIDLVASANMETTVFKLSKSLLYGDSDKSYELLSKLLSQNEKPIAILSVLSNAYVDLYRVKAALESGLDSRYPAKVFSYKDREFVLDNAARQTKGVSMDSLRNSLLLLLDADTKLKSTPADTHRVVLEELFAKLLRLRSGA